MVKREIHSVDKYIESQPEPVAAYLQQVRRAIQESLPYAEEVISYNMPAYKLDGRVAIYFAAWKHHYSVYPAGRSLVEALGDQLSPYPVSKGTIRFSYDAPVPGALIRRIAKYRAMELTAGKGQVRPPKKVRHK